MGGGKLSGRAPSPSRKDVCVLPSFKETMNLGPQGQWGRRKGTKVEAGLLFSGPTCPPGSHNPGYPLGCPLWGSCGSPSVSRAAPILSPSLSQPAPTLPVLFPAGTSEGLAKALPESYEALLSFYQETFPGGLPCPPTATPHPAWLSHSLRSQAWVVEVL